MAPPPSGSQAAADNAQADLPPWRTVRFSLDATSLPAHVVLALPPSAAAVGAAPLDVGAAPGAKAVVLERWDLGPGAVAELGCALAPADRWVDGLQDAVLSAASAMVRARGGFASLTPSVAAHDADQSTQRFKASSVDGAGQAVGRHWLGFVGEAPSVCVCSVVCSEAASEGGACERLASSLAVEGRASPPPPSIGARAFGWVAAGPELALAIGCAAGLLLGGLALRRRPRPGY